VFERAGTGLRGGDHERCQRTGLGEGGAATFMVAAFMGPIAPVRWCYPCGMWWYAIFPAAFALQALLVAVYVARAKRGKSSELSGSVLAVVLVVMWIVVVMPFRPE
jgi:hypothetical protein